MRKFSEAPMFEHPIEKWYKRVRSISRDNLIFISDWPVKKQRLIKKSQNFNTVLREWLQLADIQQNEYLQNWIPFNMFIKTFKFSDCSYHFLSFHRYIFLEILLHRLRSFLLKYNILLSLIAGRGSIGNKSCVYKFDCNVVTKATAFIVSYFIIIYIICEITERRARLYFLDVPIVKPQNEVS